jgi:uncharacterized tellurite resistance protein B-like protein|tara:strand:+ start:77 stop:523 length:447 start_codon:yes stop_codon:yes gene_type:complete
MNILKFFKKNNQIDVENENNEFDYDLLSVYLAYEVARADGDIDLKEMAVLKDFVKSSLKDNRNIDDVINDIEQYSQDNASLHDLITEINSSFNKKEKHSLISSLWTVAYATNGLDKYEDALIRKITDLLSIKHVDMLKLKEDVKSSNL